MREINAADECNDTYGRIRMYQALQLKKPEGVDIPSERTVYRIMREIGLTHIVRVVSQTAFPKQIRQHVSQTIFWNVTLSLISCWPSVSLTWQRLKLITANSIFRPFLIALILVFLIWQWIPTWRRNWEERSFIQTVTYSTRAICTAPQETNMISPRAWIAMVADVMPMLAAKACGQEN